jgi:hypothetical protein
MGVNHGSLDCSVYYFVPEGEDFPAPGTLAYCSGSFKVVMEEDRPLIKLKAEHLRW